MSKFNFQVLVCLWLLLANTTIWGLPDPSGQTEKLLPLKQNLQFSRITTSDGLSQATVHAIAQDHRGFMWFGTQEGLNRYDGYRIKVFHHDPNDANSISNNWILAIEEDQHGYLWVGTKGGGLDRIDQETGTIKHFKHNPDKATSLSGNKVRVVYQDRSGTLWVGTDGGLNRFDPQTEQFTRFQNNPGNAKSLSHNNVLALLEDREGRLWIGTDGGGMDRFDRSSGEFHHFRFDANDSTSLSNNRVRSIIQDRQGTLWVGTYEGGLNRFDPSTGEFQRFQHDKNDPYSLPHDRVRGLYQDRNGNLWIATDAGLGYWDQRSGRFVSYQHNQSELTSISDNRVITAFQDRSGVLWVGTYNGISKWNYASAAFTHIRQESGVAGQLSGNIVTTFAEAPLGTIWIGVYGAGLNRLDRRTGSISVFRHDPEDPNSLVDDRVMALFANKDDKYLWIGTRASGLDRLELSSGTFKHFRHDPNDPASLSADGVTCIYGDWDGSLWVGTYRGGLNHYNPLTNTFKSYRHDPQDTTSISTNKVLAVHRDKSGELWIGTEDGGLNRFNEETQTFTHFRHRETDPNSLGSDTAWELYETQNGDLWIGTQGNGVNRWSLTDRQREIENFQRIGKAQGLASDVSYGILGDESGYLWVSGNQGLSRIDPQTHQIKNFDAIHGLQGDEFNFGARFRSRQGELYFGGSNGFNIFYPSRVKENTDIPPIQLTGLWVLNQSHLNAFDHHNSDVLELDYQDYLVSFEFSALDFSAPQKNQYMYMLEGFDQDWIDVGSFRRATYTNLPAGEYAFRVKASNNDGHWNAEGFSLKIQASPPPWKTIWAYLGYGLFLLTSIALIVRRQNQKREEESMYRYHLEAEVGIRTNELQQRNLELKSANEQLEEASFTDSFTGLKNRRFLYSQIEQDLALLHRHLKDAQRSSRPVNHDEHGLFFMMVDLDGFKPINDTYGHEAGDQSLLQVRDILVNACRKADTLIRWGGDEFLIVGHNANHDAAETLAERVRQGIANHNFDIGLNRTVSLSCCIGFAFYPFVGNRTYHFSWDQVTAIADRALYIAKENGRNAWVGIYFASDQVSEDLFVEINEHPEELARQGEIEIVSSIKDLFEMGKKLDSLN